MLFELLQSAVLSSEFTTEPTRTPQESENTESHKTSPILSLTKSTDERSKRRSCRASFHASKPITTSQDSTYGRSLAPSNAKLSQQDRAGYAHSNPSSRRRSVASSSKRKSSFSPQKLKRNSISPSPSERLSSHHQIGQIENTSPTVKMKAVFRDADGYLSTSPDVVNTQSSLSATPLVSFSPTPSPQITSTSPPFSSTSPPLVSLPSSTSPPSSPSPSPSSPTSPSSQSTSPNRSRRKTHPPLIQVFFFLSFSFSLFHFTSLHFTSLHFTSLHFTSLHFTSLHFTSLHFTSLHFISLTSKIKLIIIMTERTFSTNRLYFIYITHIPTHISTHISTYISTYITADNTTHLTSQTTTHLTPQITTPQITISHIKPHFMPSSRLLQTSTFTSPQQHKYTQTTKTPHVLPTPSLPPPIPRIPSLSPHQPLSPHPTPQKREKKHTN
jgi:hypothetical protein